MWADYFPKGTIHAIDIEPHPELNTNRIHTHVVDQTDRAGLTTLATREGPFDVIVDDGGHMMGQQQISLGTLFPYLKPGGIYFIEDLHTSFWPVNGYSDLYGTPLDRNEDGTNSTVHFLRKMEVGGNAESPFLQHDENAYLSTHVAACVLFPLVATEYGPNLLAAITKTQPTSTRG